MMPSFRVSPLSLFLLCSVFGSGCTSSSGSGGKTMAQTMFHPSCEEPQASTAVTCDNVCSKTALCTAGLCAQQTGVAELCDASVAASLKASCLAGCDEATVQEQADDVLCLLENTCESVFLQQSCLPDAFVECGGLPTPSGTSDGESGVPTACPSQFDGVCDEPEGTGLCPEDSDPADCDGIGATTTTTGGWNPGGTWGSSSSGDTWGSSGTWGSSSGTWGSSSGTWGSSSSSGF